MMRNIAIGLAAVIAIGGSALSASALSGQESGISKGMSGSVKSQRFGPRTRILRRGTRTRRPLR
jgi:hypothetical protein